VITISIAFVMAFGFLFIFLSINYVDQVEISVEEETRFYNQIKKSNDKKIFLLGSSHIMSLNTTLIENELSNHGYNYSVYNLAKGGDVPKDRLPTLQLLINSKPEIVVYGIAERDFRGAVPIQEISTNTPDSSLPNLRNIFDEIFWYIFGDSLENFEIFSNPKLTTLTTFFNCLKILQVEDSTTENRKNTHPFKNKPFFRIGKTETLIRNDNEIESIFNNIYEFREIPPSYKNLQVSSFKEIIKQMNDNNIKTIIFVTPHHEIFQSGIPQKNEESFYNIIEEISDELDNEVYWFLDKYNKLKIWNNPSHVAVNEKAMVFSKDITDLIIKEIER